MTTQTNAPRKLGENRMPPSPSKVADLCVEQPANPKVGRIMRIMEIAHTASPNSELARAELVGMGMEAVPFLMQAIQKGRRSLACEIRDIAKDNPNADWSRVAALLEKIGMEAAYDRGMRIDNLGVIQALAAIGDISSVDALHQMAWQDRTLMRTAMLAIGEIAARHPEQDWAPERKALESIRDIDLPLGLQRRARGMADVQDAISQALAKMPGQ